MSIAQASGTVDEHLSRFCDFPLGVPKKSTCVNKSIFLSIAKAMGYHQQRYTVVVSHQSVKTVYHHTIRCASICFRNDDIQHFVLMIYRNKLRMIYKACALIYLQKYDTINSPINKNLTRCFNG